MVMECVIMSVLKKAINALMHVPASRIARVAVMGIPYTSSFCVCSEPDKDPDYIVCAGQAESVYVGCLAGCPPAAR